jgi:hypothetical protein
MKKQNSKLHLDKMAIVSLSDTNARSLKGGAKTTHDYCTLSGYCVTDFCTLTCFC